jgi:hypothetical protein
MAPERAPQEGRVVANGGTLVVVPCGVVKIWDREPGRGPIPAREAYIGAPFVVNRAYAERHGNAWVILSAKYGFVAPDDLIPGPYNVTFKRRSPELVPVATLREQVHARGLDRYETVIGLGGRKYQAAVRAAFEGVPVSLAFPFTGLPIGKMMQAVGRATGQRAGQEERPRMAGKYSSLSNYLAAIPDDRITLTFLRIEQLIGDRLPASARKHRPWWANALTSHPHARAWLDIGWRVDDVDLEAETVTFVAGGRRP